MASSSSNGIRSEAEELRRSFQNIPLGKWHLIAILLNVLLDAIQPASLIGVTLFNGQKNFRCLTPHTLSGHHTEFNSTSLENYTTLFDLPECKNPGPSLDPDADSDFFNNKCIEDCIEPVPLNLTLIDNYHLTKNYDDRSCPIVVFEKSLFQSTIASEWSLVCKKRTLAPIYQNTFILGGMVGYLFGGTLIDRIGRLKSIIALDIVLFISLCGTFLSTSLMVVFILRFISGLAFHGIFIAIFTLVMEQVPPGKRTIIGMCIGIPYSLGTSIFGLIGYFITDWRILFCVTSSPLILTMPLLCFLDESPAWLIQKERFQDARKLLERVCKTKPKKELLEGVCNTKLKNEQILTPNIQTNLEVPKIPIARKNSLTAAVKIQLIEDDDVRITWWESFKDDLSIFMKMKKISVVIATIWMLQNVLYFGLILSANTFSNGDPFQYLIGIGILESLSMGLGSPITSKVGKKPMLIIGFSVSGVLVLSLFAIPKNIWSLWFIIMPAVFGTSCAYQVNFIYTPELFPTQIRGRGFAFSALVGNIGAFVVPFFTELISHYAPWITILLFGFSGIICGLLVFFYRKQTICHCVRPLKMYLVGIGGRSKNKEGLELLTR